MIKNSSNHPAPASRSAPVRLILAGLIILTSETAIFAQTYSFSSFSVPVRGAATYGGGISDLGDVAGYYEYPTGQHMVADRGFRRFADGSFELSILDPNDADESTRATDVNAQGTIVGNYMNSSSGFAGFVLNGSSYSDFSFPSSVSTRILGIDNAGDLAGTFLLSTGLAHGFVYSGGAAVQVDYPGSLTTVVTSICNDGVIAGYYYSGSALDGFVRDAKGNWYSIPHPPGSNGIFPAALNVRADLIVGFFQVAATQRFHGFIYNYKSKSFAVVDYPLAAFTYIYGVNAQGVISGWAQFRKGAEYGVPFAFIGTPGQ